MRNLKPLAIFCGCTAVFMSDLVGNPEDRFSYNEAHLILELFQAVTDRVVAGGYIVSIVCSQLAFL